MDAQNLSEEIDKINAKLDYIISILNQSKDAQEKKSIHRRPKTEKNLPLSKEEIDQQQEKFKELFNKWMNGFELEVKTELESADADALRRFADANNLNITAKTPKNKALELISARFREKRQLMQGLSPRKENTSI